VSGINGDFDKLKKLLIKLEGVPKPAFRAKLSKNISEEAIALVKQGFADGRSPYGQPWKPQRFRTANGKTIPLNDNGLLKNSFHVVSTTFYKFIVATNVKYAATHQYGAVIKAKNWRTVTRKTTKQEQHSALVRLNKAGFWKAGFSKAAQQSVLNSIKTVTYKVKGLVFRGVHTDVGRSSKGRKTYKRTYGDWIFAQKVTIPQRQMMPEAKQGLPDSWKKAFDEVADEVVRKHFGKR
jgi:phage gpG-like protein